MTTTNPLFQILPGSGKFSWDPSTGHLVRLDADGYRVVGYAETFEAASAQNYEPSKPRFVILRGLVHNNIFWTPNMEDPTLMATGTVGYEILDYAENSEEAIAKCDKHLANRGLPRYPSPVQDPVVAAALEDSHRVLPRFVRQELTITDRVKVRVSDAGDIPVGANPFHHDSCRMGTTLVRGWMAMHEGYDSEISKFPLSHLILVNTRTGQRIRLDMEPIPSPKAKANCKQTAGWYPDTDNPLWGKWVEVDLSVTTRPAGIRDEDTIQWLLAHERKDQTFRPTELRVGSHVTNDKRLWSTQRADDPNAIVAYRIKKGN